MRRTFYELVTNFARQMDCECGLKDGECQTSLIVEGLEIHFGLIEASGMLVIQTGVGVLPDKHREVFFAELLAANNLFSRTSGMTLGVDPELDLVTLQLAWEIGHLDAGRFDNLMSNVLAQAVDWLVRLDVWKAPAGTDADGDAIIDDKAMMFLRV